MGIPVEHLAIKGVALREQLKKTEAAFDECFIQPVKSWLRTQADNRAHVLGLVKPYLRVGKPKPVIDENAVLEDIRTAVANGKFPLEELGTAVLNGTFDIANPEMAARMATSKTGRTDYTVLKAPAIGEALMWEGENKDSVGKITSAYKRIENLEDVIRGAARTPLSQKTLDEMLGGKEEVKKDDEPGEGF